MMMQPAAGEKKRRFYIPTDYFRFPENRLNVSQEQLIGPQTERFAGTTNWALQMGALKEALTFDSPT